jgi:hypothetical protein
MNFLTIVRSPSRTPFLGGVGVGVLIGFAACWGFGLFATHYHPVEESKLCHHALTTEPEKLETRQMTSHASFRNELSPD